MILGHIGYAGVMTSHGWRGIASTILHEKGFSSEHSELQLAHQKWNKFTAAYDWAKYLEPRREMMQWYADHLDSLATTAPQAVVAAD